MPPCFSSIFPLRLIPTSAVCLTLLKMTVAMKSRGSSGLLTISGQRTTTRCFPSICFGNSSMIREKNIYRMIFALFWTITIVLGISALILTKNVYSKRFFCCRQFLNMPATLLSCLFPTKRTLTTLLKGLIGRLRSEMCGSACSRKGVVLQVPWRWKIPVCCLQP